MDHDGCACEKFLDKLTYPIFEAGGTKLSNLEVEIAQLDRMVTGELPPCCGMPDGRYMTSVSSVCGGVSG